MFSDIFTGLNPYKIQADKKNTMDEKARIKELLEYARKLSEMGKPPKFSVDDYKNIKRYQHEFIAQVGVHHDVVDESGVGIWLKIDRLQRTHAPLVPENIKEWISVSNDPDQIIEIRDQIIKTFSSEEVNEMLHTGAINKNDILNTINAESNNANVKDVIFRLENLPQIQEEISTYEKNMWLPWVEVEKPRRKTIRIYDEIFSYQQGIEELSEEQPLELVWGIGLTLWNCEGHIINHPLVEQQLEVEIDEKDGAISIRPRNVEPNLALGPYYALQNQGVDILFRFYKKYIKELPQDIEFSPYVSESYESILRQAASQLSESGVFWPDVNTNRDDKNPPKLTENLQVTDTWVIYARPRSITTFLQDIERFKQKVDSEENLPLPIVRLVKEPDRKKKLISGSQFVEDGQPNLITNSRTKTQLYFPKPYNDAQVQIIDRLDESDGIVVQGPPGTGKTHTIANIICHYLATGRTVLVTSKGESALEVLREQIPEELRQLTISLLSNERQGLKQLEAAVRILSDILNQKNRSELKREITVYEHKVNELKVRLNYIDNEIIALSKQQLNPIDNSLVDSNQPMSAMELAKEICNGIEKHQWMHDDISYKSKPLFTDDDIAILKKSRKDVGSYLIYINENLPSLADMPNSSQIEAIHKSLIISNEINDKIKQENLPIIDESLENVSSKIEVLLTSLKSMHNVVNNVNSTDWLKPIFECWVENGTGSQKYQLFERLIPLLNEINKEREKFIKNPVELPEPTSYQVVFDAAMMKLCSGKKAFGLLSFPPNEIKNNIRNIKVNGKHPSDIKHWKHVKEYDVLQQHVKIFAIKWNKAGEEFGLPKLKFNYGDSLRNIGDLEEAIASANKLAIEDWPPHLEKLNEIFHLKASNDLILNEDQIFTLLKSLEYHYESIQRRNFVSKIDEIRVNLNNCKGPIVDSMNNLFMDKIGNSKYSSDEIKNEWVRLCDELNSINKLRTSFNSITRVSDLIDDSGAPNWAKQCNTQVVTGENDIYTPLDWFRTWKWKRQYNYLNAINSHFDIKKHTAEHNKIDAELKKVFIKLIELKTHYGLHESLTEFVQSALMRVVSALSRLGKGTGVRAPRHRREAYTAMRNCYGGVPCWIMPTWRISENLPSEFGVFDLVIIDEASQSDIEALPAILRAKKLLIVGDDKQVSPTAAFIPEDFILQLKHNFLRDQPFAELILPGASIYDLARAAFPAQSIMLKEHFRCVEPIIKFSMQFYPEKLLPLRIPKQSERLDPPLIDVYVPGGTRDERHKINELEARAIVEEIIEIINDPLTNNRSIGVISLIGVEQAKYIQDLLLRNIGEEQYLKHKISCGDSATFQGREKDIILLSLVVGPGQGRVANQLSEEQRFNVALSRARDRMYLFRSTNDSDLNNPSDLRLKAIMHFKNPGIQEKNIENLLDLCDSDFERVVFKLLNEKGYSVTPQVKVGPFSIDLVVDGDEDRRLAIELDGDKFHPPEKWLEDFNRQRILERVGWSFWRCWGSSFSLDSEGCMRDLVETLNSHGIYPTCSKTRKSSLTEYREYKPSLGDINTSLESKLESK